MSSPAAVSRIGLKWRFQDEGEANPPWTCGGREDWGVVWLDGLVWGHLALGQLQHLSPSVLLSLSLMKRSHPLSLTQKESGLYP